MEGEEGDTLLKSWDVDARKQQQYYYELFADRDWDCYKQTESVFFLRNIGFAIYGPPTEEPDETTNLGTGYQPEALKNIRNICETIRTHDVHVEKSDTTDVRVAVIYVILQQTKSHAPSPVFRVPKPGANDGSNNIFIDLNCRVYMGWDNYLKSNKLPQCMYCYPRNGVYVGDCEDKVIVDFSMTPEGKIFNKVLNGADKVGTILSVGTTVVSLATLAVPVAGSVVLASAVGAAAVGAYGLGRNVGAIVDRKRHYQSIGLKDSQSRSSWLSLGANTFGMAAAGATKTTMIMASRGNVLGKTGQFVVNFTQVGSLAAGGISVVNGVFDLIDKARTGENITGLEVFQLTSSILFITNSAINLKTAKTIYTETQQSVIEDFKTSLRSNRHRKAYQRLERNARQGSDSMNGDAKVIKSITNISNRDDFFSGVVRMQEHHGQGEAELSFTETGHIEINNEIRVDPSKFAAMDKSQRKIVLQASKQLSEGTIDRPMFESTVHPICEQFGVDLSHTPVRPTNGRSLTGIASQSPVSVTNLPEVTIAGGNAFANLQPSDLERVVAIVRRFFSPDILAVAVKLAEALGFINTREYVQFLEFSSGFVYQILNEMKFAYEQAMSAFSYSGNFDQNQYDKDNGIQGSRTQYFLNMITSMYSIGEKCSQLRAAYERHTLSMTESITPRPSISNQPEPLVPNHSNPGTTWSEVQLPVSLSEPRSLDTNISERMDADTSLHQVDERDTSELADFKVNPEGFESGNALHLSRDFGTMGPLTFDEMYNIAHMVTGTEANKYNAAINFYDDASLVVIMDDVLPDRVVLVASHLSKDQIFAQELL